MKPVAYEGAEPYIFVSYAHKDSECVYEVLQELETRGYRFWYDDGIAPGSEWPEDIARHLDGAAMVIAFVTQNSMDSQNCRREINFSLSREKPFVSVLMEETDMPLGMQMQLSAQQSIVRYNYDSWEGFIAKLLSCPGLALCQAPQPQTHPAESPAATPVHTAIAEYSSIDEPTDTHKQFDEQPDEPQPSASIPNDAPAQKHRFGKPKTQQEAQGKVAEATSGKAKSGKSKLIFIIAGAAAALALALGLASLSNSGSVSYESSWGYELKLDSTSLTVTSESIQQEDLRAIADMKSLESLHLIDCDLSACDFSQVTFASDDIEIVDLSGSTGLINFSFLGRFTLKELNVNGCEAFDDLPALSLDSLKKLNVANTSVTDLSPVAQIPDLQLIDFSSTPVSDITPLASCTGLTEVYGSNTQVTTLEPLFGLENLKAIDFSGSGKPNNSVGFGASVTGSLPVYTPIFSGTEDSPTTFASLALETIRLNDTSCVDLNAFQNCTRLKELCLGGNKSLTDLAWLDSQNYATLKRLDLGRTALSDADLDFIAQCTSLEALRLDGLQLENLEFLRGISELTYFSAINCGLKDIDSLSTNKSLKVVLLSHNQISDVSPLAALYGISTSNSVLDLSYNQLADVSSLAAGTYRMLMLQGNDEKIASTIEPEAKAWEVVIPWCDDLPESQLAKNRESYSRIYLLDCPQNKVLATQDAFGSGRVIFVSEDELTQIMAEDSFEYPLNSVYNYPFQLDFSYALSL